MRRSIILLTGIIALAIGGCKKPVVVQQLGQGNTSDFPTTLGELGSIADNAYANLRSQNLYGWGLLAANFATSEHAADEAGDMNLIDQTGTSPYNNPAPSAQFVATAWTGYFIGVRETNSTLQAADFYSTHFAVAADSQQIRYIRGQAYFLRAWYYFQLESFYGQKYINMSQPASADANILGVPLLTALPGTLSQTQNPRATARQVWTSIINDLRTSAGLLNGVSWGASDEARVTDWTAKALLGKAFVFTQQWDSAKTYLLDVINNSGKSLMPFNLYKQAFNENARGNILNNNTSQKFNQESLFEVDVQRVPGNGGYGIFGNSPNLYLTTSAGLFWAPTGIKDDGVTGWSMGYSNIFVHDKNLLRFGFRIPVDSIADSSLVPNQSYNPAAVGFVSTVNVPSTWYMDSSNNLRNNKTDDPRLYVCALEPYMDTVYFSVTGAAGDRKLRPVGKCVNAPTQVGGQQDYYGWSFKKYQTLDASLNEPDIEQSDAADYYLLRLADVYLLYAEACMNTSDPVTALEYVNKVHRRAYSLPVNSPAPGIDYASLNAATVADPADLNLGHNPLAYERYAELFAEGHWWFDVGRWGNSTNSVSSPGTVGAPNSLYNVNFGQNEANYFGNLLPQNVPSQWTTPASYTYPIPISEIRANAAIAAQANGGQNPGY